MNTAQINYIKAHTAYLEVLQKACDTDDALGLNGDWGSMTEEEIERECIAQEAVRAFFNLPEVLENYRRAESDLIEWAMSSIIEKPISNPYRDQLNSLKGYLLSKRYAIRYRDEVIKLALRYDPTL